MGMQRNVDRYIEAYLSWYKVDSSHAHFVQWSFENYLFPGIDFVGKRFLDIGGGAGAHSLYAACQGAQEVVCLEPETEGSSAGMQQAFNERAQYLGVENARLVPLTFQEYEADAPFDIVFCHNAINHLDEDAVVRCHYDTQAQQTYIDLFKKMHRLCAQDGYLIVADASRYNFWATIRRRNPLMPTIEWHKHQSPRIWKRLFEAAGFRTVSIRWKSPARFGRLGQIALGNAWANYFLWSHFCMTLRPIQLSE